MKAFHTDKMSQAAYFLTLAILVTACNVDLSIFREGTLEINISSSDGARTIQPSIPPILNYIISFSGPSSVTPLAINESSVTQSLPVGVWDITVQGYDSTDTEVASGVAEGVVISVARTTNVSITLEALEAGSGSIDVSVTWPVLDPPVTGASATVDGVAVPPSALSIDLTARSVRYVEAKSAGNYRLLISLSRSGTTVYTGEAVQVNGNLTSSATIALTASDFTAPPLAPTDLSVTAGSESLILGWTDNSLVEEGYRVQRSLSSSDWSSCITMYRDQNATSYTDTTAVDGTMYYYRVSAFNDLGTTYSNTASGSWAVATGSVSITITVVSPTDETITFSQGSDIVVNQASSLVIAVSQTFNSYEWVLDGQSIPGATTASLTQPCSGLALGIHHLVVFVNKNGLLYSNKFRFTVGN